MGNFGRWQASASQHQLANVLGHVGIHGIVDDHVEGRPAVDRKAGIFERDIAENWMLQSLGSLAMASPVPYVISTSTN
jgi:hypothetical protein